jgi:N-acetyl-gamma-glutamyl-phosphate reductase
VNREAIVTADLIANPGCYPTATLLPLLPFAADIGGPIITNAMSGISGAGRKAVQNLLFGERSENANAYSPGRSHRHVPEIEQQLSFGGLAVTTGEPALFFTPHLVPVKQGMAVTSVVEVNSPMTEADARQRVESAYETSAFVGLSARPIPEMRDVRNSNRCDIGLNMLDSTHLQLFSTIDNLYKGASGQAIQNLNLRLGFDERSGLRIHGEF